MVTNTTATTFLQSTNPATQTIIPEQFPIASMEEINNTVQNAQQAFETYKNCSGQEKARFLRTIADEIMALGDQLVEKVMEETALPQGRVVGERGRTCNQLRLFADLVEEGHWVDATIDEALQEGQTDLRKMLLPLGPVAVFTASNFPLAFSTAGGDTASALAAACPVIVKAHPSHLGTNQLVANAIHSAAAKCHLPKGVFASINGGIEEGQQLVKHPGITAIGFTGSPKGGTAITYLAAQRAVPIPVYAEMGSINPIFLFPEKLEQEGTPLAQQVAQSLQLGAGQFCTNPGLLVLKNHPSTDQFLADFKEALLNAPAQTMLNGSIFQQFCDKRKHYMQDENAVDSAPFQQDETAWDVQPGFIRLSAKNFLANKDYQEEIFGPFTIAVVYDHLDELQAICDDLQGQLTATIFSTEQEIRKFHTIVSTISTKVGRLIFNGVPTGVAVSSAMHHGGPFPASSNGKYTSVGTSAIQRFVRPICFQNWPDELLPEALKRANPLNIIRKVNGKMELV
jgi:NADP-dependent aldehyde dehydrogenase